MVWLCLPFFKKKKKKNKEYCFVMFKKKEKKRMESKRKEGCSILKTVIKKKFIENYGQVFQEL